MRLLGQSQGRHRGHRHQPGDGEPGRVRTGCQRLTLRGRPLHCPTEREREDEGDDGQPEGSSYP
jgi:hypothetical protein